MRFVLYQRSSSHLPSLIFYRCGKKKKQQKLLLVIIIINHHGTDLRFNSQATTLEGVVETLEGTNWRQNGYPINGGRERI
jgi:hypothetical protein